jgi:hypothetical protein
MIILTTAAIIIAIFGLAKIAGAVLAYRDQPRRMLTASLPGIAILGLAWVITHGLPWEPVVALVALVFTVSSVMAAGYEIARLIGKIKAVPSFTWPLSMVDSGIAAMTAVWTFPHADVLTKAALGVFAAVANVSCTAAFCAWIVAFPIRAVTAPLVARRRAEASAEIARLEAMDGAGGGA